MQKIVVYLLIIVSVTARGADRITLTLDDAIATARRGSVDAAVALAELRSAYWQWRSFRADQLPEFIFSATAPTYADQYSSYMDAEGNYSFVRTNYLQARGEISVNQNIRLTGGRISLVTSLDFLRQFDTGNRFMTIPVALTLRQPLFAANNMKWDARIEPVRFTEAKAAFLSATEDVALATVQQYFSLILSRVNVEIALQNLENAETLYKVAVEKREMGQISRNDLLQMEANLLEAKAELTDFQSTMRSDMFSLRAFLGIEADAEIEPVVPADIPEAEIAYGEALDYARANNRFALSMTRRRLEADYEVARAKGDMRSIDVFVQLGFTGTDNEPGRAYRNLRGNQLAQVGFEIPLIDWGKRRGRVKVAESNRRVVESRLKKESMEFDQNVFVLVERFANQKEQLRIASRNSEIARQRYETNYNTYLIGRISTLDLNDSRQRKDEAARVYVNELFRYWSYWYQLRSLTLHDFENGGDINADISRILNDT